MFTDIRHNVIFVTEDHGLTFQRYELDFTPSVVSFSDNDVRSFVVLDKNETNNKVRIIVMTVV